MDRRSTSAETEATKHPAGNTVTQTKTELVQARSHVRRPASALRDFHGPITDMAAACLANPEIAGPVTVIWTGGGPWSEDG